MASTTPALGAFPSPFSIETPPGCEGWEEMYPYYARFDERRRERDENRFWFWNSMHFPVPMPAFDVICIDSPYQAVGAWQNRVFAVPPAMGIDYRIVNGYVYISGNPVTDPAKIAERAEFFQKRAGYYYANWTELYGKWRAKMEALIAELGELEVPDLPEYEPDEVAFGDDRNTAFYEVLDAYGRVLRLGDLMWQHHFEFLLLGYGAYATFADFCKGNLPDIPDQHIAQMVAGHRRAAVPARRRAAPARAARDRHRRRRRLPPGPHAGRDRRRAGGSEAGRAWLAELERVKDPWFNMATGDGLYHYYGSWLDDPSIPYASLIGHVTALKAGAQIERPTEEIERERERLADEYGALLDEAHAAVRRAAGAVADRVPVRRGAQVLLRLLVPDAVVEQDPRVRRPPRRARLPRGREDVFHLTRHEVASALDELVLTWATGGVPLGPKHWPPIVARRKELLERLGDGRPARARRHARRHHRPDDDHAVGRHHRPRPGVGAPAGRRRRAERRARVAGRRRGDRRVVRDRVDELSTSATARSSCAGARRRRGPRSSRKIKATVTDVGGVMSHAAIVCREYGLPAVVGTGRATAQIRTGQTIRVDGTAGVVTLLDGWDHSRTAEELGAPTSLGSAARALGLGELLAAEVPVPPGSRCRPTRTGRSSTRPA